MFYTYLNFHSILMERISLNLSVYYKFIREYLDIFVNILRLSLKSYVHIDGNINSVLSYSKMSEVKTVSMSFKFV